MGGKGWRDLVFFGGVIFIDLSVRERSGAWFGLGLIPGTWIIYDLTSKESYHSSMYARGRIGWFVLNREMLAARIRLVRFLTGCWRMVFGHEPGGRLCNFSSAAFNTFSC